MGSYLQAFFHKLKREKYEPMASWCRRDRSDCTKVRRALARLQRTEPTEDAELQQSYFSPQEGQVWNWSERNSEEVMEWDGRSDAGSQCHGPNGLGAPGRKTGAAHGMKHRQYEFRIMTKLHFFSLIWCMPGFCSKAWTFEAREREKHDTCCNREQIPTGSGGTSQEDTVSR